MTMTDEERARKLINQIKEADVPLKDAWPLALLEFNYIRAEERENCAQEIEPPNAGAGDSEVDDALYRAAETIRARGSE